MGLASRYRWRHRWRWHFWDDVPPVLDKIISIRTIPHQGTPLRGIFAPLHSGGETGFADLWGVTARQNVPPGSLLKPSIVYDVGADSRTRVGGAVSI